MTTPDTPRVVILASGTGSLAAAIIAAAQANAPYQVVGLVADCECGALQHASAAGIPTAVVPLAPGASATARQEWNRKLRAAVASFEPTLVLSAGFMKILGPEFLAGFPRGILNTHPALLPAFPGAHAVRDALAYGVRITGNTVHVIDEGVDTGPIIAQRAVEVRGGETEAELHERIKVEERQLIVEVLSNDVCAQIDAARAHRAATVGVTSPAQ